MSKAVLVLDMPKACHRCWLVQLEIHDAEVSPYCGVAEGPFGGWRTIDVKEGGRPDWCPLREMPPEAVPDNSDMPTWWNIGWNACLKELEGKHE